MNLSDPDQPIFSRKAARFHFILQILFSHQHFVNPKLGQIQTETKNLIHKFPILRDGLRRSNISYVTRSMRWEENVNVDDLICNIILIADHVLFFCESDELEKQSLCCNE